jgi:hypothetical protein
MSAMVPHLQQAFHTYDELAALANNTVEVAGALELIRHGLIILAGERQVINLNSAAERIFRAEDGLYMRSGRITATSTRAEHELHCAIRMPLPANRPPSAQASRSPALGHRVNGPTSFTSYPPTAKTPMSHSVSQPCGF